MANRLDRLAASLPVALPKGRPLAVRALLLLLGYAIFAGVLVAIYSYFSDYLKESQSVRGFALYAYGGVFFVSMLTSAAVIIPAFSVLPLVIAVATAFDPFWVAFAMALGGTLGETTAYTVGYLGGGPVAQSPPPGYVKAERWMRRYGVWAVLVVSLVPLMIYDLIGIAAGVLRLPLWKFWVFTFAGRFPRGLVEVYTGGKLIQMASSFFN